MRRRALRQWEHARLTTDDQEAYDSIALTLRACTLVWSVSLVLWRMPSMAGRRVVKRGIVSCFGRWANPFQAAARRSLPHEPSSCSMN